MLSGYRIMWAIVLFDLPTSTKRERSKSTKFRNSLLKDGFIMLQYSVYGRPCGSEESLKVHIERIKKILPESGEVRVLQLTDSQFGRMQVFVGKTPSEPEKTPTQLTIF